MKNSKYNVFISANNYFYCFNVWSGALVCLEKNNYYNLKESVFDNFSEEEINKLLQLRIITKLNDDDEFKAVCCENSKKINNKTFGICISPTTLCNARCSYCFEKNAKQSKMAIEIADKVCGYIFNHYNKRVVKIRWFGGEPLLSTDIIDYISLKLEEKGIKFVAYMISNGYYVDEYIDKIKNEWKIYKVQITIDGLFDEYDKIKNYKNDKLAFKKVINNIHLLADNSISVSIRINFDANKVGDKYKTIEWLKNEFKGNKYVAIYANHISGEDYKLPIETEENAYYQLFENKIGHIPFNAFLLSSYMISRKYRYCERLCAEYINVDPEGYVYDCERYVGQGKEYACGTIDAFKRNAEPSLKEECSTCICFPICAGGCKAEETIRNDAGCLQIKNKIGDIVKLWIINKLKKDK